MFAAALCRGTKPAFPAVRRRRGMDPQALRQLARQRLRRGELPATPPERICVNTAGGEDCSLCGEPIRHPEPEYELYFAFGQAGALGAPCRFHSRCHTIWEDEKSVQ
jgi:hypothetical protein